MKLTCAIALFLIFTLIACNNQQDKLTNEQEKITLTKFLTEQEGYVKIPMKQLISGHLSIVSKVNNIQGRFILDTGSSSTIISRKHRKNSTRLERLTH